MIFGNLAGNNLLTQIRDLADAGAGPARILIYSGPFPKPEGALFSVNILLATLICSEPCGTVLNSRLTFGPIADEISVDATDAATFFRLVDSDGNVVLQGSVSQQGGGGDLQLTTTLLVEAQCLRIDSAEITLAQERNRIASILSVNSALFGSSEMLGGFINREVAVSPSISGQVALCVDDFPLSFTITNPDGPFGLISWNIVILATTISDINNFLTFSVGLTGNYDGVNFFDTSGSSTVSGITVSYNMVLSGNTVTFNYSADAPLCISSSTDEDYYFRLSGVAPFNGNNLIITKPNGDLVTTFARDGGSMRFQMAQFRGDGV